MKDSGEDGDQDRPNAHPLDLTLAQQMKINQMEIDHRLHLLGFREHDIQVLKDCRPGIVANLDHIVDEFYVIQRQEPEIALLIGDQETFHRLHSSMKRYVCELFEGYYDGEYVNKRLRIGMVHKRIGVSPKLYISAITQLENILQHYVAIIPSSKASCPGCEERRQALHKLLMFDVQLVFDTYIRGLLSEVEAAKGEVERYASSLERVVAERTRQLEELSRQDALTGLGNQRSFYDDLRRELARAERLGQPLVLVYFDLNDFKALNDRDGHRAGDELLAAVGRSLKDSARETDYCYRYGGDEFAIILTNTAITAAMTLVDRLTARFDQEDTRGVSFSIGLAQAGPGDHPVVDDLVGAADAAMYEAKAQSRTGTGHRVICERE